MSTPYILSELGDIQFEVDGMYLIMKLKPGVISGLGGGTVIDIIKSIDLKEATDLNVFSSSRVLSEIDKAVGSIDVSGSYLRKDVEDTAAEQITFEKGIKIGDAVFSWDIEAGALKISESVYSEKEVSAYGAGLPGTGGSSGGSTSLGGLVNVGFWADEVPISDRIMVQLAGATHWSTKLLSEVVGLDTTALGDYLTANNYATKTYVDAEIASKTHTHDNKSVLDLITQGNLDVLSHLSIVDGRIKVDTDFWSTGEVSAYGAGTIGGGGASGSLGGLVNVGLWADEVPAASRIMVQLAGATHWSSKLLSEVVGLDTVALAAYLSTNKYSTETYVNDKIAALVASSPATLDTLNELAAALGNDPNFATSMSTLIGTKWTQDNAKIANWDSAFSNIHSHANKSVIDLLTQDHLNILSHLSIVEGRIKVDTDLWSTGEVSAYGAGSGTGGGSGLISSVYGSAGLGGSYLDSDLTNTFNAYTINLINTNLTSALGRIGTLEANTPNVAWGNPTSQYSPLTINSVTRNLSVDGHTHSYLSLSGDTMTGALNFGNNIWNNVGDDAAIGDKNIAGQIGIKALNTVNPGIAFYNNSNVAVGNLVSNAGILQWSNNTIWHAGNDGAGSGLDADMLDGLHSSNFFKVILNSSTSVNDYTFWENSAGKLYNTPDAPYNYYSFLSFGQGIYQTQFNGYNNSLKFRAGSESGLTDKSWRTVAFTDSNVASATYSPNSSKLYSTDEPYKYSGIAPYYGYITYNNGLNVWDFKVSPSSPENVRVYMSDRLTTTRTIWGQNFNGEGDITGNLKIGYNSAIGISYSYENQSIYNYFYGGSVLNLKVGEWTTSNVNVFNIETHNGGTAKRAFSVKNNGFIGINTNNPLYDLDVNGVFRTTGEITSNNHLTTTEAAKAAGHFGNIACTWGNTGGYPTLFSNAADRWIMHINPHISYVQNGVGGYTGSLNGSTIRFAGNTAANVAWDLGVGVNGVGSDKFSVGRSASSFVSIDNTGNVGIGTTSPSYKLDVNGNGRFTDYLSASRIFSGFDSGAQGSISCSNWFRTNGATGWYNQTYGGGMMMDDYTYVKVSHNKSLWVNGNIVATGEVTAYSASDRRLKTDVVTLRDSLRIIELLNPVSYKWNSLAKEFNPLKDNNTDYGLIAQELETVMPELVHSIYDGKYKSIDYVKLIPHLICAIKQLKMEVDHLKS